MFEDNEKNNIENGCLTQDMLRNMYIGQNIPEAETAKILSGMKHKNVSEREIYN